MAKKKDTEDRVKASTGSNHYDKTAEGEHEGRLEDGTVVVIPGELPQAIIVVDGAAHSHVGEDGEGRWTYRRA